MGFIVGTYRDNSKHGGRPGRAGRALAAAAAFAVVCALPSSGSATAPSATTALPLQGPGWGVVGVSGGSVAAGPGLPSSYVPVALPAAIVSDTRASITFPRALVSTTGVAVSTAVGEGPVQSIGPTGFGRPPAGFLMAPLATLYPSSPFGFRISPLSGKAGDFHLGQDYAAPCGTKVYAADSGMVRAAGWYPWGGGNRVEIDHGNGLITTYNHLESIAVRSGDQVQAGQAIARVGSTGWSTGCHLHFETILDGRHTSPLNWDLVPLQALSGAGQPGLLSYAPGTGTPTGVPHWIIPKMPVPVAQASAPRLADVDTAIPTAAPPLAPSSPASNSVVEPTATAAPAPAGTEPPVADSPLTAPATEGPITTPAEPSEDTATSTTDPAPDSTPAPTAPPLPVTEPPAAETPTVKPSPGPTPSAAGQPPMDMPDPRPSIELPASYDDPISPTAPALPPSPAAPALPTSPAVPETDSKVDPMVPVPVDRLVTCLLQPVMGVEREAGQSASAAATNPLCEDLPADGILEDPVRAATRPE